MEYIAHRVNDKNQLADLDPKLGCEMDIRSRGDRMVVHHEAFTDADDLDAWLGEYARTRRERTLILNPKEDGLDEAIGELLKKHAIENYFYLDLTVPSAVRMAIRGGERRIAIRVSEYEPIEHALTFAGKADWIWLDSFSGDVPNSEMVERLKKDFKICLVSPELEGYDRDRIAAFKVLAPLCDAVCTKFPGDWA